MRCRVPSPNGLLGAGLLCWESSAVSCRRGGYVLPSCENQRRKLSSTAAVTLCSERKVNASSPGWLCRFDAHTICHFVFVVSWMLTLCFLLGAGCSRRVKSSWWWWEQELPGSTEQLGPRRWHLTLMCWLLRKGNLCPRFIRNPLFFPFKTNLLS